MKIIIMISILGIVGTYSCKRNNGKIENGSPIPNQIITQKGYIVFFDPRFFHFVPTKQMNTETKSSSFFTKNLSKGFQFSGMNAYYDTICSKVDTIKVDNIDSSYNVNYRFLKITPVKIKYRIAPKEKQHLQVFGEREFRVKIYSHDVTFRYDNITVDILDIKPIEISSEP